MEESLVKKQNMMNNLSAMANSRIAKGPEHLKKEFSEIVEKRKK